MFNAMLELVRTVNEALSAHPHTSRSSNITFMTRRISLIAHIAFYHRTLYQCIYKYIYSDI